MSIKDLLMVYQVRQCSALLPNESRVLELRLHLGCYQIQELGLGECGKHE
jgi:hypothetical protein